MSRVTSKDCVNMIIEYFEFMDGDHVRMFCGGPNEFKDIINPANWARVSKEKYGTKKEFTIRKFKNTKWPEWNAYVHELPGGVLRQDHVEVFAYGNKIRATPMIQSQIITEEEEAVQAPAESSSTVAVTSEPKYFGITAFYGYAENQSLSSLTFSCPDGFTTKKEMAEHIRQVFLKWYQETIKVGKKKCCDKAIKDESANYCSNCGSSLNTYRKNDEIQYQYLPDLFYKIMGMSFDSASDAYEFFEERGWLLGHSPRSMGDKVYCDVYRFEHLLEDGSGFYIADHYVNNDSEDY